MALDVIYALDDKTGRMQPYLCLVNCKCDMIRKSYVCNYILYKKVIVACNLKKCNKIDPF